VTLLDPPAGGKSFVFHGYTLKPPDSSGGFVLSGLFQIRKKIFFICDLPQCNLADQDFALLCFSPKDVSYKLIFSYFFNSSNWPIKKFRVFRELHN